MSKNTVPWFLLITVRERFTLPVCQNDEHTRNAIKGGLWCINITLRISSNVKHIGTVTSKKLGHLILTAEITSLKFP